jgi:hypothetical protein
MLTEAAIKATKILFPDLGTKAIHHITAPNVLAVLRKLEARGKNETAHRRSSVRAKSSASPSPPAELIAIRPPTCAALWRRGHDQPCHDH